jgi:predicted MFS family arabinose efflux permease
MEATLQRPVGSSAHWLQPPKAARLAVSTFFFMNGVLFASWVSRVPAVQAERGLTHGGLGLALLVIALGALVSMPATGWACGRWGSHRVTAISAAAYCASLPLLVLPEGAGLFGLALFGFGMSHGALDVAMNTQAVGVEQRYGRPINSSFHALFSAGGLVGATLGGVAAANHIAPLHHFLLAAVVLSLATAVIAVPRLLDLGERETRAEREPTQAWKFSWPSGRLILLGLVAFCVMMGEGAMADWSAVFLRTVTGTSEATAATGYAAFSIAMALGRFMGDRLSTALGPVNLVRVSGAIAAAGLSLALTIQQTSAALAGFAAVGFGFSVVVPQVFTAAGRIPNLSPGAALSIATTIGYFGFLIGPPLIGFAAEIVGLQAALALIVVLSGAIVFLAPSIRPRSKTAPVRTMDSEHFELA